MLFQEPKTAILGLIFAKHQWSRWRRFKIIQSQVYGRFEVAENVIDTIAANP